MKYDPISFVDRLGIGVRNVLDGKNTKEFWCPGSTLKVTFDNSNPLAYGMPSHGLALYLNSPAFEITAQNADSRLSTAPKRTAHTNCRSTRWSADL